VRRRAAWIRLIYLVGVPYNHFELHPVLMRKTLDGAIAEGVERVVLIGTVYPYGLPTTTPVTEAHPRNPHTFKGKMRKAQEDELLKAHAEGEDTGDDTSSARLLRADGGQELSATRCLRPAVRGGTGEYGGADRYGRMSLCMCRMLGRCVLQLAAKPEAYGRWWNFAGPGAMSQREIADEVFAMGLPQA